MRQAPRNSSRWSWRWVVCVVLLCLAACGKKKAPADSTSIDQPHAPDTMPGGTALATLERTGCYGECPVYRLTVDTDGSVVYVGTRWVKVQGRQEYKLSEQQLDELRTAFDRSGFMQMRDYDKVESTDDDWAHVSLRRGSLVKRVRHYHGDNAAPPALGVLEDEIDRIVDSARFVGAQTPSAPAPSAAAPSEPSPVPAHTARPTENAAPSEDTVADPDNHP